VTVLSTEHDLASPHGDVRWRLQDGLTVIEIVNNWQGSFAETYRSPIISQRIEQVLDAVCPHVLHVHSLLNLSFDLPALARRRGIEVVCTLHDYTLVCPSGGQRVHRAEDHVCYEIEPARCARCFGESVFGTKLAVGNIAGGTWVKRAVVRRGAAMLKTRAPALAALAGRATRTAAPRIESADITARLDAARAAMGAISLFVCPSRSIADEYQRLGVPAARLRVSDYGFAMQSSHPRGPRVGGPLHAGFIGTPVWHKGVHVILEALRHIPPDVIDLTIFGDVRIAPDYVAALQHQATGLSVRFAGAFDDEERPGVMSSIDVLIVPSLWLENSPLVIHEAFMAGVPIIASRIGGIAELITDGINGLLIEPGSGRDLAHVLSRCLAETSLLGQLSGRAPGVKTIEEDADEWERRYQEVLSRAAIEAL
jgi:glycosyltransferase involved in cell wall biosynthesis